MTRIYAVYRKDVPEGVEYSIYLSGKKRRYMGKQFVVKHGHPNDAHAQVAAFEATLKSASTS